MKYFEQFVDVYCNQIVKQWLESDDIGRKEIMDALKVSIELIQGIGKIHE